MPNQKQRFVAEDTKHLVMQVSCFMHHVLPLSRFPELGQSIRNGIMLCHKCHKEIHCNPWRNIELMKAKAEELGIDLKDRYDYDDGAGE